MVLVRRGQMSLEFLLLLLIFLALLSISLFSLAKVQAFVSDEMQKDSMGRMLAKIAYSSEEICILGEGNVRVIKERNLKNFQLWKEGGYLKISSGGFELEEKMPCGFEVLGSEYANGEAVLEMRDKYARISPE